MKSTLQSPRLYKLRSGRSPLLGCAKGVGAIAGDVLYLLLRQSGGQSALMILSSEAAFAGALRGSYDAEALLDDRGDAALRDIQEAVDALPETLEIMTAFSQERDQLTKEKGDLTDQLAESEKQVSALSARIAPITADEAGASAEEQP